MMRNKPGTVAAVAAACLAIGIARGFGGDLPTPIEKSRTLAPAWPAPKQLPIPVLRHIYPTGGLIVVEGPLGEVFGLDERTGALEWTRRLFTPLDHPPLRVQDRMYLFSDPLIYTLDLNTGNVSNQARSTQTSVAKPLLMGGRVVMFNVKGMVASVNPETGATAWTVRTPGNINGACITAGGMIVAACDNGAAYAYQTGAGHPTWELRSGRTIESAPFAAGDTVFISSTDFNVYAVSAVTGQTEWATSLEAMVLKPPVSAGDTVYAINGNNRLYALETRQGKQRWTLDNVDHFLTLGRKYCYLLREPDRIVVAENATGKVVEELSTGRYRQFAATPDSGTICMGSREGLIRVFQDHDVREEMLRERRAGQGGAEKGSAAKGAGAPVASTPK